MPSPILPCMKPADWEGARSCACRRFSVGGVGSPHLPWLAFGYDQPHTFEFLATSALSGLAKTLAQVEAEAIANLAARKASWQQTSFEVGPGGS